MKRQPKPEGGRAEFDAAVELMKRSTTGGNRRLPDEARLAGAEQFLEAALEAKRLAPDDLDEVELARLQASLFAGRQNLELARKEAPTVELLRRLDDSLRTEIAGLSDRLRDKVSELVADLVRVPIGERFSAPKTEISAFQQRIAEVLATLPERKAPRLMELMRNEHRAYAAEARKRAGRDGIRLARVPLQLEIYSDGSALLFIGRQGGHVGDQLLSGKQAGYLQDLATQQAEEIVASLEDRIPATIWKLLATTQGGARRNEYGLNGKELVRFAATVERELKGVARSKRAATRERIAKEFGVPDSYGGAARDQALRELVRKGRGFIKAVRPA